MNVRDKHTVYNSLQPDNKSPSKSAPSYRNYVRNMSSSPVNASEEVADVYSFSDDQYFKRTSLFYCSSEEDEKEDEREESLFDAIFEQQCSKSVYRRKSLSVDLKERKFFKRNVTDSPIAKILEENEIDDVSKVFKIISKSNSYSTCNSSFKAPIKTYCRTKKSKTRDVIESFGLPDTPILPDVPVTDNLLDAEVVDPSEITFSKVQDLEEPSSVLDVEKNDLNMSYSWKNRSILTSTPLSKVTVNSVYKPKISSKILINRMKDNIMRILNETPEKAKKKIVTISDEIDAMALGNQEIEIFNSSQNSNTRKSIITKSKHDSFEGTSTDTSKRSRQTNTDSDSQRQLRSSRRSETSESERCPRRRGRSSTNRPQTRSHSSEVIDRYSEDPAVTEYRKKLRSRSQEPIVTVRSVRKRRVKPELKVLISPLKKGPVTAFTVDDKKPVSVVENVSLSYLLSDWEYSEEECDGDVLASNSLNNKDDLKNPTVEINKLNSQSIDLEPVQTVQNKDVNAVAEEVFTSPKPKNSETVKLQSCTIDMPVNEIAPTETTVRRIRKYANAKKLVGRNTVVEGAITTDKTTAGHEINKIVPKTIENENNEIHINSSRVIETDSNDETDVESHRRTLRSSKGKILSTVLGVKEKNLSSERSPVKKTEITKENAVVDQDSSRRAKKSSKVKKHMGETIKNAGVTTNQKTEITKETNEESKNSEDAEEISLLELKQNLDSSKSEPKKSKKFLKVNNQLKKIQNAAVDVDQETIETTEIGKTNEASESSQASNDADEMSLLDLKKNINSSKRTFRSKKLSKVEQQMKENINVVAMDQKTKEIETTEVDEKAHEEASKHSEDNRAEESSALEVKKHIARRRSKKVLKVEKPITGVVATDQQTKEIETSEVKDKTEKTAETFATSEDSQAEDSAEEEMSLLDIKKDIAIAKRKSRSSKKLSKVEKQMKNVVAMDNKTNEPYNSSEYSQTETDVDEDIDEMMLLKRLVGSRRSKRKVKNMINLATMGQTNKNVNEEAYQSSEDSQTDADEDIDEMPLLDHKKTVYRLSRSRVKKQMKDNTKNVQTIPSEENTNNEQTVEKEVESEGTKTSLSNKGQTEETLKKNEELFKSPLRRGRPKTKPVPEETTTAVVPRRTRSSSDDSDTENKNKFGNDLIKQKLQLTSDTKETGEQQLNVLFSPRKRGRPKTKLLILETETDTTSLGNKEKSEESDENTKQSVRESLSPRRGRSAAIKSLNDNIITSPSKNSNSPEISPRKGMLGKVTKLNNDSIKVNLMEILDKMESRGSSKINDSAHQKNLIIENASEIANEELKNTRTEDQLRESNNSDAQEKINKKDNSNNLLLKETVTTEKKTKKKDSNKSPNKNLHNTTLDSSDGKTTETNERSNDKDRPDEADRNKITPDNTSISSSFMDELDLAGIEAEVADTLQKDNLKTTESLSHSKLTRSKSRLALLDYDLSESEPRKGLFRSKSSLGLSSGLEGHSGRSRKRTVDPVDGTTVKRPGRSKSVAPQWVWKKVRVRDFQSEMKEKQAKLSNYKLGSIMWAQFSHFPYWPCVITREVENKRCKKIVIKRHIPFIYCHVTFLGDNAKTAWVTENRIMPYTSKDDLTNKLAERAQGKNNLDPHIRDRLSKKWENAVAEAESLRDKTVQERLNFIKETLRKIKAAADAVNRRKRQSSPEKSLTEENSPDSVNRKKRHDSPEKFSMEEKASESINKTKRQSSPEKLSTEENASDSVNRKKRQNSPKKLKPETESKSNKSPESSKKEESVKSVEKNRSPQRKPHKTTEDSPKQPRKSKINNTLEPETDIETPLPYVPILDNENILPSRLRVRKEEEVLEAAPVVEVPMINHYSIEEQRALFKRNSLFKGVTKEKVCQYCFTLGELYKCKGGCNGYYHLTCAEEVMINKPIHLRARKKRSLSPGMQDCMKLDGSFSQDSVKFEDDMKMEESERKAKNSNKLATDEHVQIITVTSNIYNTPPRKTFPEQFRDMSLAERIDFKMKEVMEKFEEKMVYVEGSTDSDETLKSNSGEISSSSSVVKSIEETVKLRHEAKIRNKNFAEIGEPAIKPLKANLMALKVSSIKHVTADSDVPDENSVPNNKILIKHVTADGESFELISKSDEKALGKNFIKKFVTADSDSFELTPSESSSTPSQKDKINPKYFKCGFCQSNTSPYCFVCNQTTTKRGSEIRQKCSLYQCGRYFHPECLKMWPQTQWSLIQTTKHKQSQEEMDSFVCPQHVCHTCASDDPRAAISRCSGDKIVKCLRCPSSYHSTNFCVPAGTEILTATQIFCPRHRNKAYTINTTWCFLCNEGGNLICCETCPTSVHPECMPVNLTDDDRFICEDCESGRLPLYDEIVWVKLGKYKWWPGLILFPNEVPLNVRNVKHSVGEFVVRFFGTYDYYWVNRGRSFLFQEGDNGQTNGRRKEDKTFIKAIEEAVVAHKAKKEFKRTQEAETIVSLKPPPYIRIFKNKPVGSVKLLDLDLSNTTPCDCDPNKPNPCGPDSNCLNRLLLTECSPDLCPAGSKCKNQSFEKREYPPMVPYKTQGRGWGLKALAPIKKGQFVIEYVGELIDEAEYRRRIQKMHAQKEENYYFLTIDKDRMIDAGPKGNMARFMNHCCQPNCETQKWTVNGDTRVGLFANVDIPAGTELTFNYNLECIGEEKKVCRCGAPNCSGFIGVKSKQETETRKSKKVLKKKKLVEHTTLPPCFVCKRKGNVALCNNKICNKAYHQRCLGIGELPEGNKFVCPWHNCNICSKRTIRCCVKCINSFCPSHSEGNVRYDNLLGFICSLHDPSKPSQPDIPVKVRKQRDNVITEESAVTSTTSDDSEDDEDMPLLARYHKRKSKLGQDSTEEMTDQEATDSQDENEVSSAGVSNSLRGTKRKRTMRKGEVPRKRARLRDSVESQSNTATSDLVISENILDER